MCRLSVHFLKYPSQQPHLADKQTDISPGPQYKAKFQTYVRLTSKSIGNSQELYYITLLHSLTLKYVWK